MHAPDKVPLGMEVGLEPSDTVLDGDPAPLPQKGGRAPNFRPTSIVAKRLHGSIKMSLSMEVGIGPGHRVLDGDPTHLSQKGEQPPPIFSPCLLWQNGWMDQDATWYDGMPLSGATLC